MVDVVQRGGRWWCGFVVVLSCLMMSGCGGCDSDDSAADPSDAAEKKSGDKSKKKKKPDYEIGSLGVMPGSDATRYVKPGHWSMATHEVTANNFDAVCDFHAEVRSGGQPTDWPGTPFRLHTSQPAQLPKGKTRYLQTAFLVPERFFDRLPPPDFSKSLEESNPFVKDDQGNLYYDGKIAFVVDPNTGGLTPAPRRSQLFGSLHQRNGGLIQQQQPPLTVMKPHEYHFVVLSPQAVKYGAWWKLATLRRPDKFAVGGIPDTRFHLVIPPVRTDRPPPLSSHPLTWTSIAYVLWDEFDPRTLTAKQQQAMLDWLHWGGRLIISGPKSLDLLRGSFLAPYLPATVEKAVELRTSDLQPLRDFFPSTRGGRELHMVKPWAGVKLALKERARMIPNTGGLLAECSVGRGRIVVTAFRLREKELNTWGRFGSLVNTLLLRREPHAENRMDPRESSDMRYFSRDFSDDEEFVGPRGLPTHFSVAGWNDQSPVSDAARSSLREAAGIKIPKASFIVWVMAIYLIVLVPLNWGVFRLLGRVEWAWFAAPLITIVFTVAVVKLAQLDIGFARSQTEYCIVEIQGGYSRAHVTRYTALYASLSTSYEFEFDDDSALIGPFPNGEEVKDFQRRRTMTLRWEGNVTAKGFDVSSNSTGFVHSEQMFDLGGSIRLAGAAGVERIVNGSTLSLEGAVVIRQGVLEKSPLMAAWIGDLAPGDDALLEFTQRTPSARDRQEAAASSGESPDLKLKALLKLAYNHRPLKPGESRLIAWSSVEVPGMTVTPIASQVRRATLVVVHLAYALD